MVEPRISRAAGKAVAVDTGLGYQRTVDLILRIRRRSSWSEGGANLAKADRQAVVAWRSHGA